MGARSAGFGVTGRPVRWAEEVAVTEILAAGGLLLNPFEDVGFNIAVGCDGSQDVMLEAIAVHDGSVVTRLVDPVTVAADGSRSKSTKPNHRQLGLHFMNGGGPVVVNLHFAPVPYLEDLLGGRKVVIGGVRPRGLRVEELPVDKNWNFELRSFELRSAVATLVREELGFSEAVGVTQFRSVDENFQLLVRVGPMMDDWSTRFPVTIRMGIAHRELNMLWGQLEDREVDPLHWTIAHESAFFDGAAPWCYPGETDLHDVIEHLARSVDQLERWATAGAVTEFLDAMDGPVYGPLYERRRIADSLLRCDWAQTEARLAAWEASRVHRRGGPIETDGLAGGFGQRVRDRLTASQR